MSIYQSPLENQGKRMSLSEYQENKNIPCPNLSKRLHYDQPASMLLMKPKMDPSLQINRYATLSQRMLIYPSSSTKSIQDSQVQSKSSNPRSRQLTPTKSPLKTNGSVQNLQSNRFGTPININQLPQRVDNLENQIENNKNSRQVSPNDVIKRSKQNQKKSHGFFSCMGGGSNDGEETPPSNSQEAQTIKALKNQVQISLIHFITSFAQKQH